MNITVRLAREDERSEIALCIAEGFERDFSYECPQVANQ